MATSSISSSTTNVLTSLGAGSGIDTKALAKSLAETEISPRESLVNNKISKAQNSISGYNSISYVLDGLKKAFSELKNQSGYFSVNNQNSQPNAIAVTSSSATETGNHSITVSQLATAQKSLSTGVNSLTSKLNNGDAFQLTLTQGADGSPETIDIPAGADTLSGIAAAINKAGKGITAQVINTGESAGNYKLLLTGSTGTGNGFSLTSSVLNLNPPIQSAANGLINVDGMTLTPSTNKLTGLIPGTTLEFLATTSGPANVTFAKDTTGVKSKLQALVSAYNDAVTMLNTVSDPKSSVPNYGGSLTGNAYVQTVRTEIRNLLFSPDPKTKSGDLSSFLDLGFSLDRTGILSLSGTTASGASKIDSMLSTRLDDVVTFMTQNKEGVQTFSTVNNGAAGEAFKRLDKMLLPTGMIARSNVNLNAKITSYNNDLVKLQDRMAKLLATYTQQFSIMDSIIGQGKTTRDGMKSTFDGMMAAYNK